MKSKPSLTEAEIAALQTAYEQAIYEVYWQNKTIKFKIGEYCPELDDLLIQCDCYTWALITAFNPYSQCLSARENQQRHQELIKHVQGLQLDLLSAEGRDENGVWTPEQSLVIMGVERVRAIAIGRRFEQNAIVYGEIEQPIELQWL